jgi:hypothetical protein
MNVTLFYHRISMRYFKRALALLLLGVLLSLFIPGLHILFYLVLILLGMSSMCMYFIYSKEVTRSSKGLTLLSNNGNRHLVINRIENSYCFFGFDGRMKARVFHKKGMWKLEKENEIASMKIKNHSITLSLKGKHQHTFTGGRSAWKDTRGNYIIFSKTGEGWDLSINKAKVCSLTKGKMPLQKQELFDPSSTVIHFEDVESLSRHLALLFIVVIMEDFYMI